MSENHRSFKLRLTALCIICGVAAMTSTTVVAQELRDDGAEMPQPVAVLATKAGEDALGATRLQLVDPASARKVGSHDGITYFAATDKADENICLIARRGVVEDRVDSYNFESAGCVAEAKFKEQGAGVAVTVEDEPILSAYLLPDGYSKAASSLSWGTLVGDNLLVATDLSALPRQAIELSPNNPAGNKVILQPLPPLFPPVRQSSRESVITSGPQSGSVLFWSGELHDNEVVRLYGPYITTGGYIQGQAYPVDHVICMDSTCAHGAGGAYAELTGYFYLVSPSCYWTAGGIGGSDYVWCWYYPS